jgi:diaminopropionate ammonia-lyase
MHDTLLDELRSIPLWHDYRPTPLIELPRLARHAQIGRLFVKVEGARPLGNFKVLGGVLAGLRAIARAKSARPAADKDAASLRLVCASDGNHGLAVAASAQAAGAGAAIYLPVGVSPIRSAKIQAFGAEVVWVQGTYDDAVREAAAAAERGEGLLIPDTTSDIEDVVVRDVMEGYSLLAQELNEQFAQVREHPSHLFVQAGVGGLAAAMALGLAQQMQPPRRIVVVEPQAAACVARAFVNGRPVQIDGTLATSAEMLSCGLASAPAIAILLRHDARAIQVTEDQLHAAVQALSAAGGPATTPSGAAGLAGLMAVATDARQRAEQGLLQDSVVLLIATEGAVD